MSDGTAIEWTDATWNPVTGCTKVSPGCAHCYIVTTPAFRIAGRKFVNGATDIRFHSKRLPQPLSWRRPRRIFVNSLSDLFHEAIPDEFIARVYGVMVAAYWHEFQVLTKRPERRLALLRDEAFRRRVAVESVQLINTLRGLDPLQTGNSRSLEATFNLASWHEGESRNIWEGVTAENQRWADIRLPVLRDTPAAVRFVSAEPLLEDLWFGKHHDRSCLEADLPFCSCTAGDGSLLDGLDWVIVGGESGPWARPMDLAWARSVVRQCQAAGVAVFVKQLGANPVGDACEFPGVVTWRSTGVVNLGGGKVRHVDEIGLKDRKGGDMSEWPEDLRVREMPR